MHAEDHTVLPIILSLSFYLSNVGTVSKRMDISSHLFDILLGPSFCCVFLAPCTAGTKFQGDKGDATGYADYASAYT